MAIATTQTQTDLINKLNSTQENLYEKSKDLKTIEQLAEITTPNFIYKVQVDGAWGGSYTNQQGSNGVYLNVRYRYEPTITGIAFQDVPKFDYALNHNHFYKKAKNPYRKVLTIINFRDDFDFENRLSGNIKTAYQYETSRLLKNINTLNRSLNFFGDPDGTNKGSNNIISAFKGIPSLIFSNPSKKMSNDAKWILTYRKVAAEMMLAPTFIKPKDLLAHIDNRITGRYEPDKPVSAKNFNYADLKNKVTDNMNLDDLRQLISKYETVEKTASTDINEENRAFLRTLKQRAVIDPSALSNKVLMDSEFNRLKAPTKEMTELVDSLTNQEVKTSYINAIDHVLHHLDTSSSATIKNTQRALNSDEIEAIVDFLQKNAAYYFVDSILDGLDNELRAFSYMQKDNQDTSTFKSKYGLDNKSIIKYLASENVPNNVVFRIYISQIEQYLKEYYSEYNFNDEGVWNVLNKNHLVRPMDLKVAVIHQDYVFGTNSDDIRYTTKIIPINIYENSMLIDFTRLQRWSVLDKNGNPEKVTDENGKVITYFNKYTNKETERLKYTYSSIIPYDYYNRRDKSETLYNEARKKDPNIKKIRDLMNRTLTDGTEEDIRTLVTRAKLKLADVKNSYDYNINLNDPKIQDLFAYTAKFVNDNDLLNPKNFNIAPKITESNSDNIAKFKNMQDKEAQAEQKFDNEVPVPPVADWAKELGVNDEDVSDEEASDTNNTNSNPATSTPTNDEDDWF